jgi:lipooligosaccharide transport system permease protein
MEALGRVGDVVGWHARSYRRLWFGSVTTSFLNPIFFLLSIGVLLGTLVDQSDADLGGLSYLEFVAPALVAATAMQTAASATTFPVKIGLKWYRTYHAVVATPVRVGELVVGVLAWAGVRILIAASVFAAVAAIGGAFLSPLAVLAPLAALLCGLAFAAGLAAISAGTDNDQWLVAIFRFALVPLFLFSGTFFPVEQLPDWIEPLAWATPLWHGVELTRDLATGDVPPVPTAVHVAYLTLLTAVGTVIAVRACEGKLLK